MKFCNRPFQHVHLDPNGNVRMCGWMDNSIGNLLENDLKGIWHSDKAEIIRKSIYNGSFEYCRAISCPFLENDSLLDLSEDKFKEKAVVTSTPISFNVACDFTCNHSCPSCRDKVFVADEEYKVNLDKILTDLKPYINKAEIISTCGNGDVFSSPQMMGFLENLKPENKNCEIAIETNGALFDESHWSRIKHLGEYKLNVVVTPNSFNETTFKYLNGGHNSYKNVMHNLGFIRNLRKKGYVNHYEISMVMQDRNFWELPEFTRRCIDEFEVDRVVVKPLYHWFGLSEDNYWFKDVLNPCHPYHKEYLEMIENPILNNSRVYFWGAKNLHEARKHPAYRYKEYIDMLNNILQKENLEKNIRMYFSDKNKGKIYLYGDMELSSLIYSILKDKISIAGFIARDTNKDSICGAQMTCLCDYVPNNNDTIIVLNWHFFSNIKRDFDFKGYDGNLIPLNELIDFILK